MTEFAMSTQERLERLEKVAAALCKALISHNQDYAWQTWADPLKAFLKELEGESDQPIQLDEPPEYPR